MNLSVLSGKNIYPILLFLIRMLKYFYTFIFLIAGFIFINSCSDPIVGNKEHLPPNTYMSIFSMPGSRLLQGKTVKKISWWGDSPNGFVVGFKISFDSLNWGFTTQNDSTFVFSISGQDSTFRIWVASVDDKGTIDPSPASNRYTIQNSAPSMIFDPGLELPDTIFPIATLKWTGTDPDGDNTIINYWYSLNDTSHFRPVPGRVNIMTLTKDSGLVAGNNAVYMKAQDIAHTFSPIVRMPVDSTKFFYVKNVSAKILLIKDVPTVNHELDSLNNYFAAVMDTVHYDVLDIKSNNGNLIPKIINPMFVETLKLYKIVYWIGYRSLTGNTYDDPNISLAQYSLPYYLNAGGKLFWSSGFPNIPIVQGSLFNFTKIDSIKTTCVTQYNLVGDTLFSVDNSYPALIFSSRLSQTRGFYIPNNSEGKTLYETFPDTTRPYCFYDSTLFGFKSLQKNTNLVFFLLPIHHLNGDVNASKSFMKQVLYNDFGYGNISDIIINYRKIFLKNN